MNLTGTSPLTIQSPKTTPSPTSKNFPSTPISKNKSIDTNGNNESVTVTHYSEQRGVVEKISVPALNIFNSELAPKMENSVRAVTNAQKSPELLIETDDTKNNNPFLNMSGESTSPITKNSTNPFRDISASSTEDSTDSRIVVKNSSTSFVPSNPFRDAEIIKSPKLGKIKSPVSQRAVTPIGVNNSVVEDKVTQVN